MSIQKANIDTARRNLMVVVCLLIFTELAGAKIESINPPGASVSLENPECIYYFLWVVLAYTSYRFYLIARGNYPSLRGKVNSGVVKSDYVQRTLYELMSSEYPDGKKFSNMILKVGLYTCAVSFDVQDSNTVVIGSVKSKISSLKVSLIRISSIIRFSVRSADFIEFYIPLLLTIFLILYKTIVCSISIVLS